MHTIAVLPGDGIGEEVVREGLRVLEAVSDVTGFKYKLEHYPYGAEHYLKTGETFPDSALRAMKDHSAILLGAIGDPRVETGMLERAIIAGVRFGLDLYVNLRPIKLYAEHLCPLKGVTPSQLDLTVVRENTEGAYVGLGGIMKKDSKNEVAICNMVWTRDGVERVTRYAFEQARKRGGAKRVTLVDKANAIRPMDLWTRAFDAVKAEYADIETDHAYIDAACMWMIKNPDWFDVVVTDNLFGDIITDLGAMLQGGLGIAASGNIHPGKVSMFEPIHGSAPKYKGKNS
ncbi:MAG: isocitrate/isopropylmalate family dehydrogenase, partial [Planctomycetota bacterium]|nr:isocitrate/isopropylmalate family dehydrogenase [Planctomycetota bacterium]